MRGIVNGKHFEIPQAYWEAGGMSGFVHSSRAFSVAPRDADDRVLAVPISEVCPPERDIGIELFDQKRLIDIFRAFRDNIPLPPVEVDEKVTPPYRYKVYDGYHRYYASAATGFLDLQVRVRPFFDLEAFFAAERL